MLKTYIVRLSQEERQTLKDLVSIGKGAAYKIKHANILLNIDVNGQGWTDEEAAAAFSCHRNTVANLRERLVNEGVESALSRKPRKTPPRQPIIDGEVEAKLIALRCGEPPAGQARWTLRLLADKAVELEIVPAISHETVRPSVKKNELKPHLRQMYVIPPEKSAEFVSNMEDVLEIYHRPYDPNCPVICMDEQPIQLVKETRLPLPAKPGQPEAHDYEYERNGTANIFMFTEPLSGWRKTVVSERRTSVDWATEIKNLLDNDYADNDKVILVCDQLNTHKLASLYEAFEPSTARRLVERLEIHHTPKHGSWLNIAENELSAMTRQCLARRIPDRETLEQETTAWYTQRNHSQKSVDWQFTTAEARIRLKRLYPQIEN
ncbi:MAG: IS630 family transposase [Woronichinia naegeliana WA131]|uniref:IS630 family transposase n=5 Tax=Cyanophyceae TaxID=3028117 RepID=A0A977KSU4_9CYAN|nr:MAG: IS630 family transposase [Woronichinia naegeliana WA131]UXE60178.1 MAG: IS630 family transposase [Woronichinia naegeliana WA131]UXE60203.1 MAG: IS630 family transposase [Woronichinia naegeliana WA131]UXE61153.1 MAG: IS630 family transposase [Woronichinia naegeliana WA131]UXE61659.1 MAG: IS630 family transposase [Woronichinia naegeliana WA131]